MSLPADTFLVQRPALRADGSLSLRAVPGSPFRAKLYLVTGGSGQPFENVPEIAKAQRAETLSLEDVRAPVQIGDLVTLPPALARGAADGPLRKIIQVRAYQYSLQCGLQRQPFAPLACWTPQTEAQRTRPLAAGGTLDVTDLAYDPAPPVPAYLEPAPDMVKAAIFGALDLRACVAYTLAPLALGTVLRDARGDCWVAELPSDVWPLPGDCKTLMRHEVVPPAGVA